MVNQMVRKFVGIPIKPKKELLPAWATPVFYTKGKHTWFSLVLQVSIRASIHVGVLCESDWWWAEPTTWLQVQLKEKVWSLCLCLHWWLCLHLLVVTSFKGSIQTSWSCSSRDSKLLFNFSISCSCSWFLTSCSCYKTRKSYLVLRLRGMILLFCYHLMLQFLSYALKDKVKQKHSNKTYGIKGGASLCNWQGRWLP